MEYAMTFNLWYGLQYELSLHRRMSCFKEIQLILGNLNHPMKTTIIVHNDLSEIWATLDLLLVVIKCNLREIFATITLLCIFFRKHGPPSTHKNRNY